MKEHHGPGSNIKLADTDSVARTHEDRVSEAFRTNTTFSSSNMFAKPSPENSQELVQLMKNAGLELPPQERTKEQRYRENTKIREQGVEP
jgi:hypothetical protein